jgi:hypothetical protein
MQEKTVSQLSKRTTSDELSQSACEVAEGLLLSVHNGREACLSHDQPDLVPQAAADIVTYGFLRPSGPCHNKDRITKDDILKNIRTFIKDPERLACATEAFEPTIRELVKHEIVLEKRGAEVLYSLCSRAVAIADTFRPWVGDLLRIHDLYRTMIEAEQHAASRDMAALRLPTLSVEARSSSTHDNTKATLKPATSKPQANPQAAFDKLFADLWQRLKVEMNFIGFEILPQLKKFQNNTLPLDEKSRIKFAVGRFLTQLQKVAHASHEAKQNSCEPTRWLKWQLYQYSALVPPNWKKDQTPSDEVTLAALKKLQLHINTLCLSPTRRLFLRDVGSMALSAMFTFPPLTLAGSLVQSEYSSQRTFGTRANPQFTVVSRAFHPLVTPQEVLKSTLDILNTREGLEAMRITKEFTALNRGRLDRAKAAYRSTGALVADAYDDAHAVITDLASKPAADLRLAYVTARDMRVQSIDNEAFGSLKRRFAHPSDFALHLFQELTQKEPKPAAMSNFRRSLAALKRDERDPSRSAKKYLGATATLLTALGRDIARVEGHSLIRIWNQFKPSPEVSVTDISAGFLFARAGAATLQEPDIRQALNAAVNEDALMGGLAGIVYEQPEILESFLAFEAASRAYPDPGEAYRWITSPSSDPSKLIDYSADIVKQIRFLSDIHSTLVEMSKQEETLISLVNRLGNKQAGSLHSLLQENMPSSPFSSQSGSPNYVPAHQGNNGRRP